MKVKEALVRLSNRKGRGGWNGCLVENVGMCGGRLEKALGRSNGSTAANCELNEGPGHDGVRDSRGRAGRDCHLGDNCFSPPTSRVVGCDLGRNQQPVGSRGERGQSTVEFALVTAGFIAAAVALSTMWHAFGDGVLVEHALAVASHHVQAVAPATISDIFLY